MTCSWCHKSH